MLSTDDWTLSMQSFIDSSRTPSEITTSHEKMSRGTSRRVSRHKAARKCLFAIRPLSLEAPPLKQSTYAPRQAYYKIFLLESPQTLSPMIRRLARIKAVKIAAIRKLISLLTKSLYLSTTVYKESKKLKLRKLMVSIATFL